MFRAAVFVERGHLLAQLVQARIGQALRLFGHAELALQFGQPVHVRRGELLLLARQPLAPRVELTALVVDVAAVGGKHLDLLLHAGDHRALLVGAALRGAQRIFEFGQLVRLLVGLRGEQPALLFGGGDLRGDL